MDDEGALLVIIDVCMHAWMNEWLVGGMRMNRKRRVN
jgi:hypothetical protein